MKILNTNIPDTLNKTIDEQKLALADEIINGILPLITSERKEKLNKIELLKEEIRVKTEIVKTEREVLDKLTNKLNHKNKVISLLDRFSKLHSIGKLSSKKLISDVINVIKNIDRIKQDKLDNYLAETIRILTMKK